MSDFNMSFEVRLTTSLDEIAKNLDIKTNEVLRQFADDIAMEAKQLAPVDTGALQSSITVSSAKDNNMPNVPGNPDRVTLPTPNEGEFVVGPTVNYGAYVEFPGRPGGRRQKWAGHPYLVPAFEHQWMRYRNPSLWKKIIEPSGGLNWSTVTDISNWLP